VEKKISTVGDAQTRGGGARAYITNNYYYYGNSVERMRFFSENLKYIINKWGKKKNEKRTKLVFMQNRRGLRVSPVGWPLL